MLDSIFSTVITNGITPGAFAACTVVSLLAGPALSLSHMFKNNCSKSFAVAVALLPFTVQAVIMLVNGNLGTGVAVAGAFSLVRFRSAQGTAKEIVVIFMAMCSGLIAGVGYLAYAVLFSIICYVVIVVSNVVEKKKYAASRNKKLKITIPEDLDYTGVFNDIFDRFLDEFNLDAVKTTNMGTMFRLTYSIKLKNTANEKEFIDEIRVRNGNLEVLLSKESNENDL